LHLVEASAYQATLEALVVGAYLELAQACLVVVHQDAWASHVA